MVEAAYVPLTYGRINGVDQICVQARLLHQYLHSPIRFLKWFRIKTQALGFVCHIDYEPSFEALSGMPAGENFLLSLKMATVLAAAEGSDQGQKMCRHLATVASSRQEVCAARDGLLQPQTITTQQAKILKYLANERVRDTGLPYQTIWSELKQKFGIRSYLDLHAEKFEAARDFLGRPPDFLRTTQSSYPESEQEIVLPDEAREVVESYSFDLAIDSLPLLRLILRNYIFQYADTALLNDSRYVYQLLSQRFSHLEDCLAWANR